MGIIKPFTRQDAQKHLQDSYDKRLEECAEAGVYHRVTPTGLIVVEYEANKRKVEDFKEGDILVVRRVDFILEGRVHKRGTFRDSPKPQYINWIGKVSRTGSFSIDFRSTDREYPECLIEFTNNKSQTFFHCELSFADKKERFLYEMSGSDVMAKEDEEEEEQNVQTNKK